MPTISGLGSNIDWFTIVGQFVYWIVIVIAGLGVSAGGWLLYHFLSFPYKITIWPLYGSGKDGVFSFGKPKANRIKWNKQKNAWIKLLPLFNKKEVEPFDSEYIYPVKNIYAFELNEELMPARININKTEKRIRGEINPVPHAVRNWQSLQHKKNAIEYASEGWWDQNKAYVYMLLAIVFSLALCGVTVWLTYKFASLGRNDISGLTEAIKNIGRIPGQ